MRIALIGGVNIPKNGGLEMYMFNLAKQLQKDGHKVWIICQGDDDKDETVEGVRVTCLQTAAGFFALYSMLNRATNLVVNAAERYDVINYHRFYFTKSLTKVARKAGIKVCVTNHSFGADNPKHGKVAKMALKILNYFAFFGVRNCITVSDYGALLLKERYGNDSQVIHGGIFEPKTKVEDTDILKRFGLSRGHYYLTICRIDPVKELDTLIHAFMKHPKNSSVKLVVAGDTSGTYGQLLVELAKGDERVVFTGPVFGLDKETLLRHAQAYCLISQSEGFPIALLEAMSYGNICLLSDIPANHEALPQELGLWSKVGDSDEVYANMRQVEDKKINIEGHKEQAKNHVLSNFTWEKSARQFEEYITGLKTLI